MRSSYRPRPRKCPSNSWSKLIIPIGWEDSQQLQLIEKRNGQLRTSLRELCRFVPLISDQHV
ncbi:MAG: hypothetical protein DMG99_07950 [Acidobacteria bacterium]|nr:MAG: hypothetical protein DMG99_07950 [Acidobacteriota bacterium]